MAFDGDELGIFRGLHFQAFVDGMRGVVYLKAAVKVELYGQLPGISVKAAIRVAKKAIAVKIVLSTVFIGL